MLARARIRAKLPTSAPTHNPKVNQFQELSEVIKSITKALLIVMHG